MVWGIYTTVAHDEATADDKTFDRRPPSVTLRRQVDLPLRLRPSPTMEVAFLASAAQQNTKSGMGGQPGTGFGFVG